MYKCVEAIPKWKSSIVSKTLVEILDMETSYNNKNDRLIGNVIIKSELFKREICGFENHYSKVDIKEYKPLGEVVAGNGNQKNGKTEGLIYKNFVGTNLHGPVLPKNPELSDYLLSSALKKKYEAFTSLTKLDDNLENLANNYIVKTFKTK